MDNGQFAQAEPKLKAIAQALGYTGLEVTSYAGAVMNALWVLENGPALYLKFPKDTPGGGSLWDYAATACIYAEAGAWCSDMQGKPMELNRPESVFMNHRGVLYAFSERIAQFFTRA